MLHCILVLSITKNKLSHLGTKKILSIIFIYDTVPSVIYFENDTKFYISD